MEDQDNRELFVPMGLGYVKSFPVDRAYNEVEAGYSVGLDNFKKNKVSVAGYAKLWGWDRGRVRRFLERIGAEISYPIDTKRRQNQRGTLRKKRTDNATDNAQMMFIDIKELQRKTNRKRTDTRPLLKKSKDKDNTLSSFQDPKTGIPHDEIVELYNAILPELPRVTKWDKRRKAMLKTRWEKNTKCQNLGWWKGYFEFVRESDWLMGKNGKWKANLEWLIKASKFDNIVEGVYHR